jgi:hypothetical protein
MLDPESIEAPFFVVSVARLEKCDDKPGPDEVFTMSAMPGNLSVAGATVLEAETNFRALLKTLGARIEAAGLTRETWWNQEFVAMSDEEKRTWRRVLALMPWPMLKFVHGFAYLPGKRIDRKRLAQVA